MWHQHRSTLNLLGRFIIIIIIYNLLFNQYTPEHHLLISLACLLVRMLILTSPGFSRAANTDRSYMTNFTFHLSRSASYIKNSFLNMLWNFRLRKALLACFFYDTKQKSFSSGVLLQLLYCERNAEHIYKGRRHWIQSG